jgi:hypothetical protein
MTLMSNTHHYMLFAAINLPARVAYHGPVPTPEEA